jgi:hypothetical protein
MIVVAVTLDVDDSVVADDDDEDEKDTAASIHHIDDVSPIIVTYCGWLVGWLVVVSLPIRLTIHTRQKL